MEPFDVAVDLPHRTLCLTFGGLRDEATFDLFAGESIDARIFTDREAAGTWLFGADIATLNAA